MLDQCWSTICDAGPASKQHWFNGSCLLRLHSIARWSAYCWRQVQADTDPMSVKCWASVAGAGQYPFSPSRYFVLAVPACWRYRLCWHNQLKYTQFKQSRLSDYLFKICLCCSTGLSVYNVLEAGIVTRIDQNILKPLINFSFDVLSCNAVIRLHTS